MQKDNSNAGTHLYQQIETGREEEHKKKNKRKPIQGPSAEAIVQGSYFDEDAPRGTPQSFSTLNFGSSANEKASEKRWRRWLNFYLISLLLLSSICILVLLICIAGMGFWVHQMKVEIQETRERFKEIKDRLETLLAQKGH